MNAHRELHHGEVQLLLDLPVAFGEPGGPLRLTRPTAVWQAWQGDAVAGVLEAAEGAARSGQWVGGFLAYEAASAFGLPCHPPLPGLPLAWFAAFDRAEPAPFPPTPPVAPGPLLFPLDQPAHGRAVERIREAILAGETYQVNYTLPARLPALGDPVALFGHLHPRHRHPWSACLDTGAWRVASFSPELLMVRHGAELVTGPIKGTRPRSADPSTDRALLEELLASPKERAEHVMIVDMARNDLGRICRTGSVVVERLMEPRRFATVHHLETRVRGLLRPGVGLVEAMAALFPAASVTGAPKHHTMAIIRALEPRPRGIYTGALGVLRPGGDWAFNVAIRTVEQARGGEARIGLGGGIVADSEPEREWAEIGHKGAFLSHPPPPVGLLETFVVDGAGYGGAWSAHGRRMAASARALGIPWDRGAVEAVLAAGWAALARGGELPAVVRLHLGADGVAQLGHRPLPPPPPPGGLRVRVAEEWLDRWDPLLRHKTDRRGLLELGLAAARAAGCDDALFLNQAGNVASGAIRAVMVRIAGQWVVPPLSDGLLPSIWRARRLAEAGAVERSLPWEELLGAERIEMGNAVRGTARVAELVDGEGRVVWRGG